MSFAQSWNQLAEHFDLHDDEVSRLDFSSAANRMIAWPAISTLAASGRTPSETTVLDFGCGTGGLCQLLHKQGFHVTGVDQSELMIAVASHKTSALIQYHVGNTVDTFDSESVDILTCSLVLNYFPDLSNFIERAERLLPIGGSLIMADLNRSYVASCIAQDLIYEGFESPTCPKSGVLNFGGGVRVPLTIRSEAEYDAMLLKRGWKKAGSLYPEWTPEYIAAFKSQIPERFPLTHPKYQVVAYEWQGNSLG